MRSDLPTAVRAAIESATGPSLVFDLNRIASNVATIARSAEGYTTLFAAKSFPHPAVRTICAQAFDGFDVASAQELADVGTARVISVVDPTGRAGRDAKCARLIVGCETVEQVRAAPVHAEIAIRVSMSIAGRDPAVGAVQDGDARRSRFGLDARAQIELLRDAAGDRRIGLHVHHGPVAATSSERFIASARAALELADFEPHFLDLGGAWHAVSDLPRALHEVRAAIPRGIELVIEPGRIVVEGAGFACGRVVVARDLSPRHATIAIAELHERPLRVVDLSRVCHLRWSPVELVTDHPGRGVKTLFVGPTCFEEDVLGDWVTEPPNVGDLFVVRNVSGYAVGWNTSFGGVPPANVVLV